MPMRALILALQFLTRLPTPRIEAPAPGELRSTAVFVPLVGLIIGVVVALVTLAFAPLGPWVGALAVVIAWVWVTGALHLDGLADVADAIGAAHRDPKRFLEVLKDPHVGTFAVLAVVLQIAAKLVLLAALPLDRWQWGLAALVLIPAWARWGVLVWSRLVPPLRPGLAENFAGGIGAVPVAVWGGLLAIASAVVAPMLLAALVIMPLIALYWQRTLGGLTGDCLGASVEISESLLLLALVIGIALF